MSASPQVSDLIAGPVTLYYAPLGTTAPAQGLAAGAAWPAGWVRAGYSKEPLKVIYDFNVLDFMIQESLAPVKRRKTLENVTLELMLAELTAEALKNAWDGAVTTTGEGAGQVGIEEVNLGDNPLLTEQMWGFEGTYVDEDGTTHTVRLVAYKGTAKKGSTVEHGKEDYSGVPLSIGLLADMTKSAGSRLFIWQKVLEAATS